MSVVLSSAAIALVARLTAPKPDHEAFIGRPEPFDLSSISREELGEIWEAVEEAAYGTAGYLVQEMQTTRHWPAMTDTQLLRYLQRSASDGRSWERALQGLTWRADRSFPIPSAITEELRRILGDITPFLPTFGGVGGGMVIGRDVREALCIARHLQLDESGPEVEALVQVLCQSCADTRYLKTELDIFLGLTRQELCQQCWPVLGFAYSQDSRYQCLPEQFLRDACQRLEAIHSGKLPYVGYKAFAEADVTVLCWAYRMADRAKVTWLPHTTNTLLLLATYAPDKKSKSLPSQTLACRLAEEISLKPTPEGIASLHEACGLAINATVKRTLGIRLVQAKTAMALRPDVVLGLVASSAPDKKQQTMLATLLQASYCTGLDFSLTDWKRQLINSTGAAEFSRNLIWFAQTASEDESVAFMVQPTDSRNLIDAANSGNGDDGAMCLINCNGQVVHIEGGSRIRLWHPLHSSAEERKAWQCHVTALQVRQPLRQAFREYYEPLPQELQRPLGEDGRTWRSNESHRFAEWMLSLKPLIGLARGQGWKIDRESGLVRQLGEVTVTFGVGEELHPGIENGEADSTELAFWKGVQSRSSRLPIREVEPIIYSESCRAADLLVSVSSFAYTADDPSGPLTLREAGIYFLGDEPPLTPMPLHPVLKRRKRLHYLGTLNIADMAAMRRQVLGQVFAGPIETGHLIFETRSVKIGDYTVNLATAQVQKNGEQIELKLPKNLKTTSNSTQGKNNKLAAVPWLPYDESLLEKLANTIAFLLRA